MIWRQEGRWWCQGLGSANGTQLIEGSTKALVSVELPQSLRQGPHAQEPARPVELCPGDALCLGLRTRFLVLLLEG